MDIIATVGTMLALGGAFDLVATARTKRRVVLWLIRATGRTRNAAYATTRLFNRFFGPSLFSSRSIGVSILLSIASMVTMFAIAIVTSDPQTISQILDIAPRGLDLEIFGILLIFMLSSLTADVISYAQIRLFVRTSEHLSGSAPRMILLVSSIAVCLTIFGAVFALARLASYAIVVNTSLAHLNTLEWTITPKPLAVAARQLDFTKLMKSSDQTAFPYSRVLRETLLAEEQPGPQHQQAAAMYLRDAYLAEAARDKRASFVTYSASPKCMEVEKGEIYNSEVYYDYAMNQLIIEQATTELGQKKSYDRAIRSFRAEYAADVPAYTSCTSKLWKLSIGVDTVSSLAKSRVIDLYMASLLLTFNDLVQSAAYKFGGYVSVDPYVDVKNFMQQDWLVASFGWLGVGGSNSLDAQVSSFFQSYTYAPVARVNVPFSVLAASSVTPAIVFLAYIVASLVGSIYRRGLAFVHGVLPAVRIRSAPGMGIMAAASTALVAVNLLLWVLDLGWGLLVLAGR